MPVKFWIIHVMLGSIKFKCDFYVFISDISKVVYPYEKTIYYGVAILSFLALLTIVISLWQIINKEGTVTKKSIVSLISGVVMGILARFTTCIPLFL